MRIEKRNSSREKTILTGMIVSRSVLSRLAAHWEPDLFTSKWANIVAQWCIDYFKKWEKAPGKNIEKVFTVWAEDHRDKDTVALVEKFLTTLSKEYASLKEELNADFVVDLASGHFNKNKLANIAKAIEANLEVGDVEKATKLITDFSRVEVGIGAGINVLQDESAIRQAFEEKREPLITYPGSLGEFFGDAFEREGFIAFMGSEKRGKSWWLIDVAWQAMIQRRRVAFFSAGDLSQGQMMRRLMTRAAGRPLKGNVEYKVPVRFDHDPEDGIIIEHDVYSVKKPLSWQKAKKACEAVMQNKIKSKDPYLKLSCHATDTLSVAMIANTLELWSNQGWDADVVIIDYADILAPPYAGPDSRDQINTNWKRLATLRQTRHCCVITATQADAGSYNAETIGKSNFADDKRKYAHVTGTVGINQTPREKEDGIYRLNWLVLRENDFSESKCVYVAGCLHLCRPAMMSTF